MLLQQREKDECHSRQGTRFWADGAFSLRWPSRDEFRQPAMCAPAISIEGRLSFRSRVMIFRAIYIYQDMRDASRSPGEKPLLSRHRADAFAAGHAGKITLRLAAYLKACFALDAAERRAYVAPMLDFITSSHAAAARRDTRFLDIFTCDERRPSTGQLHLA